MIQLFCQVMAKMALRLFAMPFFIPDFAESYIKPFGTIFLNLIKFIVVPIVLFSIMCGIISMSDIRKVGSIGLKTVVFYLCTTAFAVTIGLIGGNLFKRDNVSHLNSPEIVKRGGIRPSFHGG